MTTSESGAEVIRSEERLRVGTRREAVERVRLARRIVTEVRQVEIEVRREELVIERESLVGTGEATAPRGAPWPARDEIVMVLSEEVPMITMGTRAYERVRVRVERITEAQAVTEPVRREEVVVDDDARPER